MGKDTPSVISRSEDSFTVRLEAIRSEQELHSRGRKIPLQLISDALINAGYTSLDAQAKALGLRRSTAWTIMRAKHKLGRLNDKTARCILANPDTPASVRVIILATLDRKN